MLSMSGEIARDALDAVADAVLMTDQTGVIRFINRSAATLFAAAREALMGASIERWIPEWRLRTVPCVLLRSDGARVPVELSITHAGDSTADALVVVLRHPSQALGSGRLLALANHDLRQPLQALSLVSAILRRTAEDPDLEEVVAQQEEAVAAMTRLLNGMIELSKLEEGLIRPQPAPFSLAALLEELRCEVAPQAEAKGLRLAVELQADLPAEPIATDRALLAQVLRQLLSNAIRFTREGGVTVRARRCAPTSDGCAPYICLAVSDSGIGIASDQLPRIFDEFHQVVRPANRGRDGYGLGLSIVQRLVPLLGATLEVSSELGRGSSFTLRLPAAAQELLPCALSV